MRDRPDPATLFIGRGRAAAAPETAPWRRRSGGAAAAAAGAAGGGVGAAMADGEGLLSVDYEVYGKVQGVFFRKYTQVRAAVPGRLPRLPAHPLSARCGRLEGPRRGRAGRGCGQG